MKKLREQGGAYGGGMTVSYFGDVGFYSYRDPRLDATIQTLTQIPDFLSSGQFPQSNVDSAIIRTVGHLDRPRTAPQKAKLAMQRHFSGITKKDLEQIRRQVLTLDTQRVKAFSDDLDEVLSQAQISATGNKAKLKKSQKLKTVIEL